MNAQTDGTAKREIRVCTPRNGLIFSLLTLQRGLNKKAYKHQLGVKRMGDGGCGKDVSGSGQVLWTRQGTFRAKILGQLLDLVCKYFLLDMNSCFTGLLCRRFWTGGLQYERRVGVPVSLYTQCRLYGIALSGHQPNTQTTIGHCSFVQGDILGLNYGNCFCSTQQPPVGQGLLIHEVSRSHNDAPRSVGLLWTRDQLAAVGNSLVKQNQMTAGQRALC